MPNRCVEYFRRKSRNVCRSLVVVLGLATSVLLYTAVTLTREAALRPYGVEVFAVTSDSSYFDWIPPLENHADRPDMVIGATYAIRLEMLSVDPGRLSRPRSLVGFSPEPAAGTMARVDSLMVWWRPRFASWPMYDEMAPETVDPEYPVLGTYRGRILCMSQAKLFRYFLLGDGIASRYVGLSTTVPDDPMRSGHSVLEVWVSELQRWILVDPMMGTRYLLHDRLLSLQDLLELRSNRAMSTATVHYAGRYPRPFQDHRFSTRYLGASDFRELFNYGAVTYVPQAAAADPVDGAMYDNIVESPTGESTTYHLHWSPDAGLFEPFLSETRRFWLRVIAAVGAWVSTALSSLVIACLVKATRIDAGRDQAAAAG